MDNAQLLQKVSLLEQENAELRAQIDWFKKHLFGTGKSEKVDALQMRLGLEEQSAPVAPAPTQTVHYERRKPAPRETPAEHFKDLPVMETKEVIPEEVKAHPELYERIGQEETFEVDIVPPRLFKRLIVRLKFRHRIDRERPPVIAPAPVRVVQGGYASAGLLAWVALSKYVDHLPLYRQEKMSARWGATISRKTMADWIEVVSEWFLPIYGRMRETLLKGGYLQVDETPVRFVEPDQKKAKSTQGYLWVIGKPGSDVVFDWRLSRKHDEATSLLKGFAGVLQSDGYQAYDAFAKHHEQVVRVGCWAHVRRKFAEASEESPGPATLVLRLIGQMYGLEKHWDERRAHGSKFRKMLRQTAFTPILSLLRKVVDKLVLRVRPTSTLGKACSYLLSQWTHLVKLCDYGQVRIDNNLIENAIRPSAVGKKNFLFIGHPDAGQRSAIIYSIVVSCQRHGIDPLKYMTDVLTRLPCMTNQDDLTTLLPSCWKPAP